jgi:hypothetical protein
MYRKACEAPKSSQGEQAPVGFFGLKISWGSHRPGGLFPGLTKKIFEKNFHSEHVDTGGVGVPSPGLPPGAGRGGRLPGAPVGRAEGPTGEM